MTAPHLLLFSLAKDWLGPPRLAGALARAGFAVSACCPDDSFLAATRYLEHHVPVEDGVEMGVLAQRLVDIVDRHHVQMVIPGDDPAIWVLHALCRALERSHPLAPATAMLRRSLAPPDRREALELKTRLHEAAAATGAKLPAQIVTGDPAAARAFADAEGMPVVVKCDRSWGGSGVTVCADAAALDAALVAVPPGLERFGPPPRQRVVQRYVAGQGVLVVLVAWAGELLAGFAALKRRRDPEATGPSTVIEALEHPALIDLSRRLIRYFGISGFADVEFQLARDGTAYLMEINPRAQPHCHLGRHFGADLAAVLMARMTGGALPAHRPADRRPVALFPKEWCRDPASPYLTDAFHDVPWDDPALLRRLVAFGEARLAERFR